MAKRAHNRPLRQPIQFVISHQDAYLVHKERRYSISPQFVELSIKDEQGKAGGSVIEYGFISGFLGITSEHVACRRRLRRPNSEPRLMPILRERVLNRLGHDPDLDASQTG